MPSAARSPRYLVRHGQSEWNVRELTQGQAMAPALTALGREQARAAAETIRADLGGAPVAEVRTSDLTRARQTAEVVADALAAPVVLDQRLREHHLGTLEGLPHDQAWVAVADHDWSDPHLPVAGGESPHQVGVRMSAALADADDGRVIVLVSHADAIRVLLARLSARSTADAFGISVPNGTVLRLDGDTVTPISAP